MKIQCDVCNKDEASVFCSADEAALCDTCDHRVHHANKLAGKHLRFSLLHPSPKQFPLCDICQEKRAFLFCQQDRAILCRDCDIPIHKANEHTQKHNRFLLTGVKLSATSALYSPATSSSSTSEKSLANASESGSNLNPGSSIGKPISSIPVISNQSSIPNQELNKGGCADNQVINGGGVFATSSISEYLIETLPGWHFEDFIDNSTSTPTGFSKSNNGGEVIPFWDSEMETNMRSLSSENMGIWVPQAPPAAVFPTNQAYPSPNMGFGGLIGGFKEVADVKSIGKVGDDGGFTVPQISPQSLATKRPRTYW